MSLASVCSIALEQKTFGISQKMAYEGNLYNSAGEPLTGSYNMRFSIVSVSEGSSSVIWGPETHTGISVSGGWFSVILGENTAISPELFDGSPLYLRIEIANPPASSNYELMTPSTAIVSVGTAFRAIEARSAVTVADGSITAAKLAAGAVTKEAISTSNTPEANQYLRWYNNTLQWATVSGGGSSAEADNVTIGTNDSGSLEVKDFGISSTKISTSAVTAEKLASRAVTLESIATPTGPTSGQFLRWSGTDLQWSTVSGGGGSGTPDGISISTNIYGSLEVMGLGISTEKIANNAVTTAKLGTNAVTADAIAAGAVTTPKIASDVSINTSGKITAEAFYGSGAGLTGIVATTANYATLAGSATSAASAVTANTANYAVLSGTATTAATANIANYAAVAGTATTAATATIADTANYATLAGSATSAASAVTANTANYAVLSGTATTAATTNIANYAAVAGTATTAATATIADTANYATLAGSATSAASATTANYSALSGTATSAATAVDFSGTLSGDITGTQGATAITTSAVTADKLASNAAVLSFASLEAARLTGNIDIKSGTNIFISQDGQTIEVSSAAIADIPDYSISSTKIATSAVTAEKLAADINITTSGSIAAVSIAGTHFGDGSALTGISASIGDYSVTSTKIATSAVADDKIALIYSANKVSAESVIPGVFGTGTPGSKYTFFNNLGIGTNDASALLHVYSGTSGSYLRTEGTGDTYNFAGLQLRSPDKSWELLHTQGTGELNNFAIQEFDGSNYYKRLIIEPGGNVGIGTADATSRLTVVGTIELQEGGIKFPDGTTAISATVTKDAIVTSNVASNDQYLRWYGGALQWSAVAGGGSGSAEPDNITIGRNVNQSLEVIDLGISTAKLANSAVTAVKLAPGSVTNESLAPGTFSNITGLGTLESLAVSGEVVYTPSVAHDVSAGSGITGSMLTNKIIRVQGSGGPVTVTADPPVASGQNGQIIILRGLDETNTVTLSPGSSLKLSGGYSFTLGSSDSLMLCYDGEENLWFELARSDN